MLAFTSGFDCDLASAQVVWNKRDCCPVSEYWLLRLEKERNFHQLLAKGGCQCCSVTTSIYRAEGKLCACGVPSVQDKSDGVRLYGAMKIRKHRGSSCARAACRCLGAEKTNLRLRSCGWSQSRPHGKGKRGWIWNALLANYLPTLKHALSVNHHSIYLLCVPRLSHL